MDLLARLLGALRAGYLALVSGLGRAAHGTVGALGRSARSVRRTVSPVVPGEWKQRIALLFLTGLAFVPIIYSGNMTWSFSDPSGHLDQGTAAVVDEDAGADTTTTDGAEKHVDVGREFADKLVDMDRPTVYHFVETDRATAEKGLADGTYVATIEVPKDFSANVVSLGGDAEKAAPALLTVKTNDTINYVGGNFTKSVGTALRQSLTASVLEQYLDNVYIGFTTIHDQTVTAADGAAQLADGSARLHDGTGQLRDGTAQAVDGTARLESGSYDLLVGLEQLNTGVQTLQQGATTLASGAGTLSSGLGTLDSQSGRLRSGASTLADGASRLSTGASTLANGTSQVADGTAKLDQRVQAAKNRADQLGITQESVETATQDLQTGIDDLTRTASDLNAVIDGPGQTPQKIAEAARARANAANTVATQAEDLATALESADADSQNISTQAAGLTEQLKPLTDGVATASGGSQQHADDASAQATATNDYTRTVDELAASCTSSPSDGGGSSDVCTRLQQLSADSKGLRDGAKTVSDQAAEQNTELGSAQKANTDVQATLTSITTSADHLTTLLHGGPTAGDPVRSARDLATLARRHATDASTTADDAEQLARDIAAAQRGNGGRVISKEEVQRRITALHDQATEAVQSLPDAYDRANAAVLAAHRLNEGAQQVNQGAQTLSGASSQLADGASTLSDGVNQYTDGVHQARTGADTLADGSSKLAAGADRLADGAGTAVDGATQLHDGAVQLHTGSVTLADGARQADEGAAQLADGSKQLSDGLQEGKDKIPSYTDAQREHLEKAAADPVGMDFVRVNGLSRFGDGLAPLFLSISLWVGGMAIFLMMPPFAQVALRRGSSIGGLLLGGLIPAQLLGLVQTVIAVGVLHLAVGVPAKNLPLLFGMACLTSVVFVALNHGFGAIAGPVGKFIALVLVALQISGAGGTYPVQTLPGFFQAIHPYLPMTHSVNAFRGAIGGGWVAPETDIAGLLIWLLVGLLCGIVGAALQRRRAQRDLAGRVDLPTAGRHADR